MHAAVYYSIGHLSIPGGDSKEPWGEYVIALNKITKDRYLPTGPELCQSAQLIDIRRAEGPAADGLPGGTNATVELLRLCGYEVDVVDAGCCGMAGTFGFEAEHYDLSMRVGERLFKSEFRNRNSEIVSSGAACRMQIRHGMGVEARHPLILVRDALREGVFASRAGAKVEPQGGGYSGG